ncbi:hypothetical protein AAEX28_12040 [Lentisphaerota bacterium WC36G]|nr:hypothetical protein LJT99_14875 [Lentisphaerae bacterium WC36]
MLSHNDIRKLAEPSSSNSQHSNTSQSYNYRSKWLNNSGEGISDYHFESIIFLKALKNNSEKEIEEAIRYLEVDPYYFCSGYVNQNYSID